MRCLLQIMLKAVKLIPLPLKACICDAILPICVIPAVLLLSSISFWWTVYLFTIVVIFFLTTYNFFLKTMPHTKFFFTWTITSIVVVYLILELIFIPFLDITFVHNLIMTVLVFWFTTCLERIQVRTVQLSKIEDDDGDVEKNGQAAVTVDKRFTNCGICKALIPEMDHHCVWYDCCIGQHNQGLYIISLTVGIIYISYCSNLILTSVCDPYYFFYSEWFPVYVPIDCSEVYLEFGFAVSFVSAIYSIIIAILMLVLLIQQVILVSFGLSMKEWRKLSVWQKFGLWLCLSKRPTGRELKENWKKLIYSNKIQYHIVVGQL